MNHPVLDQIERTGYPVGVPEPDHYGLDGLGNEVFSGDEIYVLNDEFFLKETLMQESREVLETLGAEEKKA
ncbi:hypothetical protein [Halobacillus sp. Nhm2S1]|uniref:YqaI family protein n=1 Tax=Halobacillus sp. Nhm2S1 TaxID=2866716 RepID=UPI001C73106B|nr:hypothetical protein [Halobacillus sp. Nhm2S1]MBX0358945.1 hypothetical protein [Halobacillus sp. Nhm2S1]